MQPTLCGDAAPILCVATGLIRGRSSFSPEAGLCEAMEEGHGTEKETRHGVSTLLLVCLLLNESNCIGACSTEENVERV